MSKGERGEEQGGLRRSLSQESQKNISVQCSLGGTQDLQGPLLGALPRTTKEKWCPSVPPVHMPPSGRVTRNGLRSVSPRITAETFLHSPVRKQQVHTLLQTQRRSPLASVQSSGEDTHVYGKKTPHYFRFTARPEPKSPTLPRNPLGLLEGKTPTRLPPLKRIARKGRSIAG